MKTEPLFAVEFFDTDFVIERLNDIAELVVLTLLFTII